MIEQAVLIAGPTASGKSAAALELALREDRVIVNADSMQVYCGIPILSASPGPAERERVPHLLYGEVAPWTDYSVGTWLRDVARLEREGAFARRPPTFVGGTGLYFRALCGGLAPVPPIPPEIRSDLRKRFETEGAAALHRELRAADPSAADRLSPSDGQRVVRALEVVLATGRSLLRWQETRGTPLVDPTTTRKCVLLPERLRLVERIERRFDRMLEDGALEEARSMETLGLPPSAPAAKALGLRELQAFLRGATDLAQAVEKAKAATRQYAKRQATWFRHQTDGSWRFLSEWSGTL